MSNLEEIKNQFKPYRYTKKGNVTILESTSGNIVVKEKNKDLSGIFNYLKTRNFDYFPKMINSDRLNANVFEYVEDISTINPQKSEDLIKLVALLHSKTSFYKEVRNDQFQEIFDNISNNINYYKNYYNSYYELFLKSRYMSPSEYEFTRNYSKIYASLLFCEEELNNWYNLVKENNNERISLIHNNLELNHYIRGEDKDYLISWDNATFDSPVLDLVHLYKKEFFNVEFSSLFKIYNNFNQLNESELKLFFIMISLPYEIDFSGTEFEITKKMRLNLDYIFKTEEFLKPYYTKYEEKK